MRNHLIRYFVAGLLAFCSGCAGLREEATKTCLLHDVSMRKELVELRSGVGTFEYFKAREAAFPNAATVYNGEFVPSARNEMTQTFVCPECQKAEAVWFREHRLFRK